MITAYYNYDKYLQPIESVNCIKKYNFVTDSKNGKPIYKLAFIEVRPLGKHWYTIRHDMNKNHHVTNIEDMEIYVKNFLRL